ncbi:AraC-type DNA-binding protein [Methylobacterium sp. 174MFSha1.1]|uniref:helix-turn-helix domain-containing protein n=1 Tax=Methylobacterium sp. 174MFSha1.1 TaxID=1502749 RepID=UPI0008E12744|nr:helix-turn-helix domain-containing protein [Methylobacterium sp. 174MFSha1.1]SFV08193.1 AraC-type DNA-binding protein [Methylobacterium sp. 174MFSha1.1]
MQTLFTTADVRPEDRFLQWRELCEDRLVPMVQSSSSDEPFQAVIEGTTVGSFVFTKFSLQNLRASTTPQTIRHKNNKTDHLFLSVVLSGSVKASQNDRSTIDRAGDLSVRDPNTPWTIEHEGYSEVLAIEIPRDRLERVLGSSRHFVGLGVGGHLPVTTLARSFLHNLSQVGEQLTPESAERMSATAIDLVAASIAERMALEVPGSLRSSLTMQKAKSYIDNNIGDTGLSPMQVSSAVGVSLRHLQVLFRESGQNIAAWIWHRRLENAARRLADPISAHMMLQEIAYRCGFSDQAHFSRRFRSQFGMSPSEYRHEALVRRADARAASG